MAVQDPEQFSRIRKVFFTKSTGHRLDNTKLAVGSLRRPPTLYPSDAIFQVEHHSSLFSHFWSLHRLRPVDLLPGFHSRLLGYRHARTPDYTLQSSREVLAPPCARMVFFAVRIGHPTRSHQFHRRLCSGGSCLVHDTVLAHLKGHSVEAGRIVRPRSLVRS